MSTRRNSLRYPGHDYREPGSYFVTIRTHDHQTLFGQVLDGTMRLTRSGEAIRYAWQDIATAFPGVVVDGNVFMPDHLHGILTLGTNPVIPAKHSLPEIIRQFKNLSHAQYRHHVARSDWSPYRGKLWQQSYHDRIIRNDRELDAYRAYIEGNPGRWWERHGR
jgi:REP element-mobilizing transposase RayT